MSDQSNSPFDALKRALDAGEMSQAAYDAVVSALSELAPFEFFVVWR